MYFRKQICRLVDHTMSSYLVGGSVALEAQGWCSGYEPHDVDVFFPDNCDEDFKIWCAGMSVLYPSDCKNYHNNNHIRYDFILDEVKFNVFFVDKNIFCEMQKDMVNIDDIEFEHASNVIKCKLEFGRPKDIEFIEKYILKTDKFKLAKNTSDQCNQLEIKLDKYFLIKGNQIFCWEGDANKLSEDLVKHKISFKKESNKDFPSNSIYPMIVTIYNKEVYSIDRELTIG